MYEHRSWNYYFLVKHDRNASFLTMKVHGFMEGSSFREHTLKMLRLLKKHSLNRLLLDTRSITLISYSDRVWLESLFIPYALEEGFRKAAIIRPVARSGRQSVENVVDSLPHSFYTAFFDRKEEAVAWLERNG